MSSVYGTREEILKSIFDDVSRITTANGYAMTVGRVTRQFEGQADYPPYSIVIDGGARTEEVPLLKDLIRKTTIISIIGLVNDDTFDGTDHRTVITTLETFIRAIETALAANPSRGITVGAVTTPKAYVSTIVGVDTDSTPPMAAAVVSLKVVFYDTK